MPNSIEIIKERVNKYKDLITKKEDLQKEYDSTNELYGDLKKELALVRAIYDAEKTEAAEIQLNEWLQQERDFLELMDEYIEKLNSVNNELGTYDEKIIKEQEEYLANVARFKIISDRMNELEKKGLKLYSKADIGTNVISLDNAEGRHKHIHQYDAEEYINLVNEKVRLAKLNHKMENKCINWVPEEVVEEKIETEDMTIITPKKPSIKYDDQLYRDLPVEERIKIIEEKMEAMRNAGGRKNLITCCGEKIYIAREYAGNYSYCAGLLKKYKNQLNVIELPNSELVKPEKDLSQKLIDSYNTGISDDDYYLGEEFDFIKKQKPKTFDEEEFNRQNDELFKMLEDHQKEVREKEINEKDNNKKAPFIKVTKVIKPKNKEKLKDKIKKYAVIIAASVALASSLVISSLLMGKQAPKNTKPQKDNLSSSTTQNVNDEELNDIKGEINEDIILEEDIVSETEDSILGLGASISIQDDAEIYNNMYDATLKRNGLSRYFKEDINKNVGGLVVNLNGELKTYYFTNPGAEQELNDAILAGGTITSVLCANENGYEGFYNIDDVKVLSENLGGMNR